MIRVLHVVGGMNQGGTENFIMNIYRNIDREKFQFDFLVNRKGFFDDEIKSLGGKIYYLPALQKIGQLKFIKNIDNFLYEHKKEYNIIHSHINQVSGLILERANKAGIPIRIAHSHNNKYGKNYIVRLYKMYLGSKINDNANLKLACSNEAGQFLYGKNAHFNVIKNSIEINKFLFNKEIREKVRKELNIEKDCFVIGCVGRLVYQKNPLFLLKIFKEFTKINENSKLIIVGKGNLKNKVIKCIRIYNLEDKVVLLEDRKDVNELMQAMDYFVLPSRFEGLGIVLIEAQTAGLRCIASEKVIAKEVKITELLQFYSLKNNPKKWAKEIFKQKKYKRYNKAEEIIRHGYNIDNIVEELEKIYNSLLKERVI